MHLPPEYLRVGGMAMLTPINHPNHMPDHRVTDGHAVRTSVIVSVDLANKRIETLNTIYQWSN